MKRFAGQSPGSSRWRLAAVAGVTVVLLAVGIAFGGYFVSEAIDGTSVAQESDQPTAAAPTADSSPPPAATPDTSPQTVADSSPVPAVTPEPSPEPSAPPASPEPSPTLPPCLPCEARDRDQLQVNAPDIQLAPEGKYYVPDRGDGCSYQEIAWSPMRDEGWVSLYDPGCGSLWLYLPATGEVQGLPVCPCWEVKGGKQLEVTAAAIQLGPDGKYYIPDRGDGCAYRETGRSMLPGPGSVKVEVVFLWAPGCEMGWTYEPATGRLNATIP